MLKWRELWSKNKSWIWNRTAALLYIIPSKPEVQFWSFAFLNSIDIWVNLRYLQNLSNWLWFSLSLTSAVTVVSKDVLIGTPSLLISIVPATFLVSCFRPQTCQIFWDWDLRYSKSWRRNLKFSDCIIKFLSLKLPCLFVSSSPPVPLFLE